MEPIAVVVWIVVATAGYKHYRDIRTRWRVKRALLAVSTAQ